MRWRVFAMTHGSRPSVEFKQRCIERPLFVINCPSPTLFSTFFYGHIRVPASRMRGILVKAHLQHLKAHAPLDNDTQARLVLRTDFGPECA